METGMGFELETNLAESVSSAAIPSRYIRFGPFQLDQETQEVTQNGVRLKIQGKVYQVLLALLEKRGEVLSRDELRLRLWSSTARVNYEANVNTTVNKLRQALGDSSDKPKFIETVPRKGYCLTVMPEFADDSLAIVPEPTPLQADEVAVSKAAAAPDQSNVWMTLAAIGLIVAGMLLGAGLTRIWMTHFTEPPVHVQADTHTVFPQNLFKR
jgi:DNA-binding winged helix-turn-helix (wHTH) protein